MRPVTIVVLAKAPQPGYAKTRLIPALGAEGAARLARWLLDRTLQAALASGLGPVELCAAPDVAHPAIAAWGARPGVILATQGDGDLGARMARAFARALAGGGSALLIGTDAPRLDADVLRAAAQALESHDAVFVPAHDGGYALVGLQRPAPALFEGIAWSTPAVMAQTRAALRRLGLTHAELAPLHDIDEPADLAHLEGLGWTG
ncbi:MAG: TIGR04282 family arsenosugar biosynthesis glycosyltransferase [Piscinibacter sp.]|nr:TIGR04282 family arsenosugar biosynthesis glycosyltransferase [Piscinibacter sp.]